jgi:hypothetical protein
MPNRRPQLLKLLSEIEQNIAEAESILAEAELTPDDRKWARAQLEFFRRSLARVERMLETPDQGK